MADVDYFLKIKDIEGESEDKNHKNEIDVLSFSWGETQTGSSAYGGGASTGKINMQDFHFTMKLNKATPKLMLACSTGKAIGDATFVGRKSTGDGQGQEYMIWKFYDLIISSYQTGGSGGSDSVPTESISFNYAKMEMEYKLQDAKGTLKPAGAFKYDLKQNQGSA